MKHGICFHLVDESVKPEFLAFTSDILQGKLVRSFDRLLKVTHVIYSSDLNNDGLCFIIYKIWRVGWHAQNIAGKTMLLWVISSGFYIYRSLTWCNSELAISLPQIKNYEITMIGSWNEISTASSLIWLVINHVFEKKLRDVQTYVGCLCCVVRTKVILQGF